MIQQVFSIYDCKIEAYMLPFFAVSKGSAIRTITDLVRNPEHPFAIHPEDYTLFYLGQYDDSKATFIQETTPTALGVCLEFKSSE